jgi:predicted amidohydrolase YtcJ
VLLGLTLSAPASSATPIGAPDDIYVNARVWTGNPASPAATAFAVADGRFVAVGDDARVRALAGAGTRIVDLGGRRVVPGFNDSHWHLPYRRSAALYNAGSVDVLRQRLLDYVRDLPPGAWIVGRGWMPNDFPDRAPHRRYLDATFPDRPVVLRDRDGHTSLANSRALALAGITRETRDPPDGVIERDADGQPTGYLKEAADDLVLDLLPSLDGEATYRLLLEELATAASFGITSLQELTDVGLTDHERGAVERAEREGTLLTRFRVSVPVDPAATPERLAEYVRLRDTTRGQFVSYGLAKLILDGTVDARTAYLIEPYTGGGRGEAFLSQGELDAVVAAYDRAGLQIAIHAIGDAAIRMSLDAYERAARVNGPRDRRHRVEHVEVPALADLPRFAALGVVASTQAIGCLPDATTLENYAPLLGPERSARAYSPRHFDDAGARQAFGSDYPVYPMDPLLGLYAAATRQDRAGLPPGGWHPANRIGIEAGLRHYTVDAAYASFEDDVKGTVSVGKYADFVVLSHDVLAGLPERLLETRVLLTVTGGRVTYRAAGFEPGAADSTHGPERAAGSTTPSP